MTQDEIIEMANEAGNGDEEWSIIAKQLFKHFPQEMQRFAKLVAQHEREACARVCELMWHQWLDSPEENEPNKPDAEDCYRAIRARGEA
jgi:hypothetical protein